jgi:drug/metabolite transporter (DMT)-like permease
MEAQAILLLVVSAAIHATWNFLAKGSLDKQVFLWLSLVAISVAFFVPFWLFASPISPVGWAFILLSGTVETAYFFLLGGAYQRGDLSIVYPVVRGSSPLFVTLFAYLFLGERVHAGALAGIALVVAGIYTLHVRSIDWAGLAAPLASLRERPSQLALLTGLANAGNVVIDKVGIGYTNPVPYLYLVFVVSTLLLAPYMALARRAQVAREWRTNKVTVVLVGIMSIGSYLLVLFVLTTTRVSYASPVREVTVVFGALLGTLALREPFARNKIAGSILIFAGIALLTQF